MLPLVWLHPTYSKGVKITVTVIMLAVSFFLFKIVYDASKSIADYYDMVLNQPAY